MSDLRILSKRRGSPNLLATAARGVPMKHLLGFAVFVLTWPIVADAAPAKCAPDAVKVGTTCVDKYEASVWHIDPANKALLKRAQRGKVTLADLTAGGATQVSPSTGGLYCVPGYPPSFPVSGNWTAPLYAVSVAGVAPTGCTTWFQAEQACALSGKRLLSNQEWQRAAAGTPDPGTDNGTTDCSVSSGAVALTGSRASCHSSWLAFDMVGNVTEWVGDWVERATGCTNFSVSMGADKTCFSSDGSYHQPAGLWRGGYFNNGPSAGVFAAQSDISMLEGVAFGPAIGFRCAR